MPISKKWRNYIKFLISETGNRVDGLSDVVGFNIREGLDEIEPKHARYVTTMLKQEQLYLESGNTHLKDKPDESRPLYLSGVSGVSLTRFKIETPYDTTMLADSDEELLQWARKRFKDKPNQLKKVEVFLRNDNSTDVEALGYKIKRQAFNDSRRR